MDTKAVTFKFNPKSLKWDFHAAKKKFDEILHENKDILTSTEFYEDYCEKVTGYHFNGFLTSTSYKTLLQKYKNKGPLKDKTVFMFMKSIPEHECDHWRTYCLKRQCQFNVHRLDF